MVWNEQLLVALFQSYLWALDGLRSTQRARERQLL